MANRKKRRSEQIEEESRMSDPYVLKKDAVRRLTQANETNSPNIDPSIIDKYKSGFLYKLPMWLKASFIKFWFAGAVCYFFVWGLSIYITHAWDLIFVLTIAMGIVTDLLTNNVMRFFSDELHDYTAWIMFPKKKFWTLFANIAYAGVLVICVVFTYQGINNTAVLLGGDPERVVLGVEPILFGLFYFVFDLFFITIKKTFKNIIKDAKEKAK